MDNNQRKNIFLMNVLVMTYIIANTFLISISSKHFHPYMSWNVFLAWLPLLFVSKAKQLMLKDDKSSFLKAVMLSLFLLWLLFYPNSPYIITDYIHIADNFEILKDVTVNTGYSEEVRRIYVFNDDLGIWIEFIAITLGVWIGYMAGFFSLKINEQMIYEKFGKAVSVLFTIIIHLLTGYAITIGRFERWNSWDVFVPSNIIKIIVNHMNIESFHFTLLFALMSFIPYFTVSIVINGMKKK